MRTPEEKLRRLADDERWNDRPPKLRETLAAPRTDEPHRRGLLVLAAVVTVLAVAGAGVAIGHYSHRHVGPKVASTEKPDPVIPWKPLPPAVIPGDVASPPLCDADNLTARSNGGGPAGGSFHIGIDVSNSGPLCSMPSASVTLRTQAEGGRDTVLATAVEAGRPSDPHLIAAHSSVGYHVGFGSSCQPTRTPGSSDPTMSIGVAGSDVPVTGTTLPPELASCGDVYLAGPERALNEVDPYPQLTVSLALPASAQAGSTLSYRVTLTNRSEKSFTFRSCPNYYQNVSAPQRGHALTVHALNCQPMKTLPRGEAATFAMRTRLPATAGPTSITWHLKYYSGPSSTGTVLLE